MADRACKSRMHLNVVDQKPSLAPPSRGSFKDGILLYHSNHQNHLQIVKVSSTGFDGSHAAENALLLGAAARQKCGARDVTGFFCDMKAKGFGCSNLLQHPGWGLI